MDRREPDRNAKRDIKIGTVREGQGQGVVHNCQHFPKPYARGRDISETYIHGCNVLFLLVHLY